MNSIREKNLRDISGFSTTPDGWLETTIDEICNIGRGRVISAEEIKSIPGDYPVFSSQTREYGEMGSIGTYDFDGDYVTWTTDGENAGTVFFRSGKFNCTNVCGTLNAKNTEEIDLQFLSYHLGRIAKRYVSYIGNPKLMNGVMANVGLALPGYSSQKKIAKILTTIDQLIEKTQALIDKHTAIKQGMMADLFTRGIDPTTGQLRPPVEQAPHLYKETELGWVPKEWSVDFIDNILERVIDYRGKTPTKTETGIPLITAKNVRMGFIEEEPREYIADYAYDGWMTRGIPVAGDVLFTTEAPLANVAQIETNDKSAFAQRVIILRCNNRMNNDFLKYSLMSNDIRTRIFRKGSGSTVEG